MQVASKAGVALLSLAGHSILYEQFHGFSFDEPWIVEGTGLETFGHYYPWPKGNNCSQSIIADLLIERFLPTGFTIVSWSDRSSKSQIVPILLDLCLILRLFIPNYRKEL